MTFTIEYDNQPLKFLKGLDKHILKRLIDKTELTLSIIPVPHNAVSIVGEHGAFRIRIGDFRVLYRINYTESKIIIFKIDKRERVY